MGHPLGIHKIVSKFQKKKDWKKQDNTEQNESSQHEFGRFSNVGCLDKCCSGCSATATSCSGLCVSYGSTTKCIPLFTTINSSNLNHKFAKSLFEQYPNSNSDPEWHSSSS